MKKAVTKLLACLLTLSLALVIAACAGDSGQPTGETQQPEQPSTPAPGVAFVFTGAGTFQRTAEDLARDLNVTITGYQGDGSILLTVAELPQIQYTGRWVLVENKGYKIYFDDNAATFVYVRYDPDTGVHSFHYPCDFGVAGTSTLTFTYSDPGFSYDGEGLGLHPPVIVGQGRNAVTLTCNEDGTLVTGSRTGTWAYLEDTNQYYFHFDLDTGYQEAFKLDEWDKRINDFGKDGDFEWQLYDYDSKGFGGNNALRIDSVTGMPCGVPEDQVTIDEATGRHTFINQFDHEVYYIIDPSGQPNFFNEVYANFDEATGTYSITWSTNGFSMCYATFTNAE